MIRTDGSKTVAHYDGPPREGIMVRSVSTHYPYPFGFSERVENEISIFTVEIEGQEMPLYWDGTGCLTSCRYRDGL